MLLAARLGFEPRYSDSESEVLPLDDLAILARNYFSEFVTPFKFFEIIFPYSSFASCIV